MKGAGTDDSTLVRCVVSRSEVRSFMFRSALCFVLFPERKGRNYRMKGHFGLPVLPFEERSGNTIGTIVI